jgi:hypothetical protein
MPHTEVPGLKEHKEKGSESRKDRKGREQKSGKKKKEKITTESSKNTENLFQPGLSLWTISRRLHRPAFPTTRTPHKNTSAFMRGSGCREQRLKKIKKSTLWSSKLCGLNSLFILKKSKHNF